MIEIAKKWNVSNITRAILNSVAFIFVLLIALNLLFGWDWNVYLVAVMIMAVGSYLMGVSGFKQFRTIKLNLSKKNLRTVLNMATFAVGLLTLYIGVTTLPQLGILTVPVIAKFNGWILLFAGILSGIDAFNKI